MNVAKKKYTIFIVDDDPFIRRTLEIKLRNEAKYQLLSFSSGEECMAAIHQHPDLVIMDYNMGNHLMNGMEAMKKIKEVAPETEVAILSAQDEIPVAIDILNQGAIEYLSKEHALDNGIDKSIEAILVKKNYQDEIAKKNQEILRKNKELEEAQVQILKANQELKEINANLDQLVRKRTATLVNTLNKLKESKDELENFVYRASHDLKGPTARLLGLIQVSQMLPDDPSNLGYMEEVIKGLDKIVENFIYVHTLHKNPIAYKKVYLPELIEDIFDRLRLIPKAENILLEYEIIGDQYLIMDTLLLQIILNNLLENAIYFHKALETKGRFVRITCENRGNTLKLMIKDNGQGIAKEIQEKVFQMFFRGSQHSHGNGLGLYLVDKAVNKLEGEISLKSEEGDNTVFTIELPIPVQ